METKKGYLPHPFPFIPAVHFIKATTRNPTYDRYASDACEWCEKRPAGGVCHKCSLPYCEKCRAKFFSQTDPLCCEECSERGAKAKKTALKVKKNDKPRRFEYSLPLICENCGGLCRDSGDCFQCR